MTNEEVIKTVTEYLNESCKGYKTTTSDGEECDCEYEFSGRISCEECIFGPGDGKFDPRSPLDDNIIKFLLNNLINKG